MKWQWERLEQLKPLEQYAMHRLRQEVFVVEQQCVYLDADGLDNEAWHLLGWASDSTLEAYLRVIPHVEEGYVKIGRVVTSPQARGKGIGKLLMTEAMQKIPETFGNIKIKMSAQLYLERFYNGFHFHRTTDVYDEDGIPHIEMVYNT